MIDGLQRHLLPLCLHRLIAVATGVGDPVRPTFEHYSLDGSGNNAVHPQWGARMTAEIHRYGVCYADGVRAPRFVADGTNPNSTRLAYDDCVRQCHVEQARVGSTSGTWSYMGRGPVSLDFAGALACEYACNDMLSVSARAVSNRILTNMNRRQAINPKRVNELHTYFGHLLSHEMHHSRGAAGSWPIRVPECDAWWDPQCTGTVTQGFERYPSAPGTGSEPARPSAPLNYLSAWLDGNVIYGGDDPDGTPANFNLIRTGNASDNSFTSCRLKMVEKPDFSGVAEHEYYDLPLEPLGYMQFNNGISEFLLGGVPGFTTGDIRGNVDPGSLCLIIVFARLHNQICDRLSLDRPEHTAEENFWEARKWVAAYMQKAFYYEYVPALLGTPLPAYNGYDPGEDPALDPYHTAAAMRYGHSEVNEVFFRLDETWKTHPLGHITFRDAVLNPGRGLEAGVDAILRGVMSQPQGRVDTFLVDYMVNGAFSGPARRPWTVAWGGQCLAQRGGGSTTAHGQLDLQAVNIQRGRDQGLCGINSLRAALGLPTYSTWQELVMGPNWRTIHDADPGQTLARDLEALYGPDVDNGDLWIAGLAECKVSANSNMGPTFSAVVSENWARIRRADRFHFENLDNGLFTAAEVMGIFRSSLSEIIKNTTAITDVPDRAFFVPEVQMVNGIAHVNMPTMPDFGEFSHALYLSPYYKLAWTILPEEHVIDMAISAPTLGWVGIGFVKLGSHAMLDSDIVLGRVDNGIALVDDMYADRIAPPVRDIDRIPPGQDNLANKRVVQENGVTTVYFRRPIDTRDLWDRTLVTPSGKVHIAFAFQPQGKTSLEYHGATRGYADVQFFPPNCSGGTFLDMVNMDCATCPSGRFRSSGMALTQCDLCPVGSFQPSTGQSACLACAALALPGSTTEILGATGASACLCPQGAFLQAEACAPCREGLACPGGLGPPLQAESYSAQPGPGAVSAWRCPRRAACPPGPLGLCSPGTQGTMCLQCVEPESYWSAASNACLPCSRSGAAWAIPLTIGVAALFLAASYRLSLSWGSKERLVDPIEIAVTVALVVFLLQAASAYDKMSIPWGSPIDEILRVSEIFDLSFDFLRLDCAIGAGPAACYIAGCFVPAAIVCMYATAAPILAKAKFRDAGLRCWNAVGVLFQGLFIGLLLHGIAPFVAIKHPNGERTMRSIPGITFRDRTHGQLSICGIIHLLVYGGGFSTYCIYACWQLRRRARSKGARGIRAVLWHRFLYVKFKPARYYWSIVHLLRSTLIALIPVVFESPHMQIIMLQLTICTSLALQAAFWPYRSGRQNFADVAACAVLIALTLAASFFAPVPDNVANRSVVMSVVGCMVVCGLVMLCVFAAMIHDALRRTFMNSEQWALFQEKHLKLQTAFFAELQQVDESELAVLEAEQREINVNEVCSTPMPMLESKDIVRLTRPGGSLSFTLRDLEQGRASASTELTFMAPSEHVHMKQVRACLRLLEERLRCRVQEHVDSHTSRKSVLRKQLSFTAAAPIAVLQELNCPSSSAVTWNPKEREWVARLSSRVKEFQSLYSNAIASDPEILLALQGFVTTMEQQFKGVYQACVRDILMAQPGYQDAIRKAGLLREMLGAAEGAGAALAAEVADGRYCELMEAAVRTQEATLVYAEGLARATGGRAPRTSMKHLYRILEKMSLDPKVVLGGEAACCWDSARMMVLYTTMQDLARGVERLRADHASGKVLVLRVKERFSEPTSGGWSDILVNLKFPSSMPHISLIPFELQLAHTQLMVIRKDMGGHTGYAKYRSAKEILEFLAARHALQAPAGAGAGICDAWESGKPPWEDVGAKVWVTGGTSWAFSDTTTTDDGTRSASASVPGRATTGPPSLDEDFLPILPQSSLPAPPPGPAERLPLPGAVMGASPR